MAAVTLTAAVSCWRHLMDANGCFDAGLDGAGTLLGVERDRELHLESSQSPQDEGLSGIRRRGTRRPTVATPPRLWRDCASTRRSPRPRAGARKLK